MKAAAEQIKTAYDNARFDIDSLMNLLEMELAKTPEHLTWAHVGDLNRFRQEMIDLLAGITGRSEHSLREALDEIREDAKIMNEQNNA